MLFFKYSIKQYIKYLLVLLVVLLFLFAPSIISVNAENDRTLNDVVLEDLEKDDSFNKNDYPSMKMADVIKINKDNDKDNDVPLMEIIHITETNNDTLCIYVYIPTDMNCDLNASLISMSVENSDYFEPKNTKLYELELLSTYEVFSKYVVKDYEVNDEPYRYYNITSIYRDYVEELDKDNIAFGTEKEDYKVALDVGQQWCFYWYNDVLTNEMVYYKTIYLEAVVASHFECLDGLTLDDGIGVSTNKDLWFYAFKCDEYVIKHIYNATLTYKTRTYKNGNSSIYNDGPKLGEWSSIQYKILKDDQDVIYKGDGILAKEYKWKRILSAESFINDVQENDIDIKEEYLTKLQESQWVFTYLETDRKTSRYQWSWETTATDVGQVGVLQIDFLDDTGRRYNLGVVSDLINPNNDSAGFGNGLDFSQITDWFEKILLLIGVLILVLILYFCFPIFKVILDVVVTCIKFIFKGVIFIIGLPFYLIEEMFKNKK